MNPGRLLLVLFVFGLLIVGVVLLMVKLGALVHRTLQLF